MTIGEPKPTYVTKPFLPPLAELMPYMEQIWENGILTNKGPFHEQLEAELCAYLGVEYISLFANGTLALITGLQALGITGEVITTPYSFVATSHSLLWNGLTPVFADVNSDDLNLDPTKIETAITNKTTAILPVHCYGNACDVDEIDKIASRHGLKVIYDAAHAFGVRCHCGSVLNHGDLSILSFHATKVFNTFEGGAIVCKDKATKEYIDHLKNFGFDDETTVSCNGINGKMNEFQAAFGLVQLKHIDHAIAARRKAYSRYIELIRNIQGIRCLAPGRQVDSNYSYFPVFVEPEFGMSRDRLYEVLKSKCVFARRYFYPLISEFPMYRNYPSAVSSNLPNATEAADRVLCLPIFPDINEIELERIVDIISCATK